jgi:hypothetical protein
MSFPIRRNADGSLPHVGLGGAPKSMYDGGTGDEYATAAKALEDFIAGFKRGIRFSVPLPERAEQIHLREPIRVQAEVGQPVPEIEASP